MPDPTITHQYTTAAVPEWAAAVTGDARDAEIARLRVQVHVMSQHVARHSERACKLAVELADVKAECCRLTDVNGDRQAELAALKSVLSKSIVDHLSLAGQYEAGGNTRGAMQLRAAANLLGCIFQGGTPATVCPPATEVARPAAEPEWLVEGTTLYTLDECGNNRVYAKFDGFSATYDERCELAKRCRDALNSREHAKEPQ